MASVCAQNSKHLLSIIHTSTWCFSLPPPTGDEESEEEEFGNVHIIELHKAEEPLGIHLTHFTGPDGV